LGTVRAVLSKLPLLLCLVLTVADSRAAVVISEVVADNATGLQDEDGAFSDWIELHNDGAAAVNLAGWALTDEVSDDNKWGFPAVSIGAGQFLVVFASGKDRRVVGANLHTNFSLSAAGEYLSLRMPSGAVASEFAPAFPQQFEDKSYGLGQDVQTTQLVAANAAARAHVPANGSLGSSWTAAGFSDASWTAGTQGVGYESTVPGFAVRNFKANIAVNSTTDAETVIATPSMQSALYTETRGTINFLNTGSGAHYGGDVTFPGLTINVDVEDFVLEAKGTVTIPAAGNWTFGVNSDDGFALTVGSFSVSYPSPRGPADTLATFNFPTAGDYPIRLVFYERGGGSEVELFAWQGSSSAWTAAFRLVGDTAGGGLAVKSVPTGSTGGIGPLIGTNMQSQMFGVNATAYARIPFSVADVSQLQTLTLRAKYDDGIVAWINGVEVARRNAPTAPAWNSAATAARPNAAAVAYESMDANAAIPALVNGPNNVLAIQLLNVAPTDTDALVLAELAEYEITGIGLHYFSTPSPGGVNGSDYYAFTETPAASVPRGFFDAAFPVALTCATPGAQIRYTTNGSAPTATTGTIYTVPINITGTTVLRAAAFASGFTDSRVMTQSYFFLDQVIAQPVLPAGFPSTWGTGVNADYEMDPNITSVAPYAGQIKDALKSIPTLSIVTSMDNMFGTATGIYSNPTQEGVAWERPASVEWLDPTGGGHEFQVDCGIRAQGGASRNPGTSPKHGFRLLFKEQYGPTKLKFAMFNDSAVKQFDTLVLHARFNDAWVWNGASAQYIRDMWCRDTQLAMGWPSPHGTYVHLYVNGMYWGMYDPGEKPDASFAAEHLGGDKSEYDAVNSNEFIDGNATAWNAMFAIAAGGLASDAAYANIQHYLDVPNFVDYMLVNLYAGNTDWPSHNWTAARRRVTGAGYKFFSWDAEWTFSGNGTDVTGASNGNTPGQLWQALRANAEFRRLVGDHAQRHCFNGGVLTPAACDARWMARA
jgi:CotH kinase protein/Chitobiase/beta-hexosaminidase C-terminal domain/Lamin Tail Domain/PA14 domain